jgi:hypothetical protein
MDNNTIDTIKLKTLQYMNEWRNSSKYLTNLPFVTLTYAQSIDGSITAKKGVEN